MLKIAMIGAGSQIFSKTLSMDIMATKALQDCEIRLMSPTESKISRLADFLNTVAADSKIPSKALATTDRRKALDGADFVIVMIQVGGVNAFQFDYEIPLKYGVDQCIGDSMGPGGVFRGLRTIPVLLDIARDMAELCPGAIMLNYSNPMAANCLALGRAAPKLKFAGLCHGVQTTLDLISRYTDTPKENIEHLCAGINHMAWFLALKDRRTGADLRPALMANIEKPEYYINEKVRCEVARNFGYFMTESTGHLSEYVPWFRKNKTALKLYCDQPGFGGASGAYYHYCRDLAEKLGKVDILKFEERKLSPRSVEYCGHIMEAVVTGKPFVFNGNVRNDGYISNLPDGCCVEVPVTAGNKGLHPRKVGALPSQCAALNMSNVMVQQLAAEAAIEGDPEKAVQAVALDPLTAAVLRLDETRKMTAEMIEAEAAWLPQFKGGKPADRPLIKTPKNIRPVDVPLDPALAIANRFDKLAKIKG
jgi:alpha-galactosidase